MQYGLKQYIFVIRELTAREIKRKYSRSVLGILWSVLNPLLFMIVMSAVFSELVHADFNYPIYYITGYSFWCMFKTASFTSITTFKDNKRLIQASKIPKTIFVLSRDYTELVNMLFSCIALVIVYIFFRVEVNWTIVFFFMSLFFELLFSIGISLILATIYVFITDIRQIWKTIIIFLRHMVAIYIPLENYPEKIQWITKLNPMFIFPDIARKCVLFQSYELKELQLMIFWGITVFAIGIIVFKLNEDKIVSKL